MSPDLSFQNISRKCAWCDAPLGPKAVHPDGYCDQCKKSLKTPKFKQYHKNAHGIPERMDQYFRLDDPDAESNGISDTIAALRMRRKYGAKKTEDKKE